MSSVHQSPIVFLDRDGVINEEKDYLHKPEDFEFIPGAPEAIARLNAASILVVVVTNQSGVARGYYTEDDVHRLHAHIQTELKPTNAHIDAFYYSPYHPQGTVPSYAKASRCRKPEPGMFEEAIETFGLTDGPRFVVGDKRSDLEAGLKVGCTAILVRTGYGRATEAECADKGLQPDLVVEDLSAAVDWILGQLSK